MSSVREIYESGLHRFYYPDALDLIEYPLDVIRKFEAIGREGMEGRGARNDVVRKWSQGVSMVEYLGHGGIIVLSKQAMFLGLNRPDNDVDRLEETDNIPFVFIRSCLSGAVNWPTFPGEVSVSEALIRARKKGATSVISAVGTEQQADQERFARHFYDGVLNHALNNIGAGKVYGHCRSILQNERYIDVCNQYISHGEPTLAFSRPETIDDLSVSFSMGRPEGVLHLAYQPSFEGSAQIRVHNLTNLLYQSDPIHVDPKGFDGTFPLNLPYEEPGPYYVCVYQWNEANHRDAYGSTMFDTAAKAKLEIVHRLEPIPGNGVSPASRVEINFRSDLIRENHPIRGTLRIEGREDLSQPRPFEAWLNGATIGSGTLSASSLSVFPFETTFGHAGPETLKAVISASPTAEATWTQVFQEVIQIDESPTLKVAPLEIEPDRPVVGETVELRTVVECIGSVTATLSAAEMFLNGESLKEEETPSLWRNDRYAFPIELSPGESLPLAWRIDRFHPSGKYESRAVVRTPDRSFAATRDLQILNPPEIKTLSIEPLNQPAPIGEDGSAIFRVTVRNVGEATSDPMIVEGADTIQGATFEGPVPALEPGQEATVEVQVDNSSSKYLWIATYRQEPTAVSLRTRSGPEKFPVEIERSISLASNGDPDRPIHWVAEKKSDLSAFTIRYFDATQAGYWPTEENRFFDFPPGELEFPDTSEIFAATQAGLAALEYPDFWWITPNRLQFSPTRQANPIHFILPWREAKVLAKISPKFATHNQGYLGYPSPFLTLISSEATFDLNFSNTTFDGLFPPKVMEVSPPGLEWELRNKPGGWPSFAGFLFMALPEIRSPVIELDSEGPWSVSFDLEWSNKKEMEPTYQVKHRTGGGSWSAWELVGSQSLHGNQFMFRCWFDPGGRKSDYSIRSATIEFSKD
ncbi:MAG: hypothetical protein KC978_09460 [Candidatus Omnitrophica bacterium]|nr:hypothetical protein [Candidatus Omnitrophota bacterium]